MDKPKLPLRVADQSGDIVDAGDFFVCTPKSKHAQFIVQACNSYEPIRAFVEQAQIGNPGSLAPLTEYDRGWRDFAESIATIIVSQARGEG